MRADQRNSKESTGWFCTEQLERIGKGAVWGICPDHRAALLSFRESSSFSGTSGSRSFLTPNSLPLSQSFLLPIYSLCQTKLPQVLSCLLLSGYDITLAFFLHASASFIYLLIYSFGEGGFRGVVPSTRHPSKVIMVLPGSNVYLTYFHCIFVFSCYSKSAESIFFLNILFKNFQTYRKVEKFYSKSPYTHHLDSLLTVALLSLLHHLKPSFSPLTNPSR